LTEALDMTAWLTLDDERNFGSELLDVAIRAAKHGLAPELERLHGENQDLRDEVSRTARLAIDQCLDREVPDWRQVNVSEDFHRWLLMPEPYSGIIRDRLLKDAVRAGDASRVAGFFKGYLAAAGRAPAAHASQRTPRTLSGTRIYSRDEITRMWERRRKGAVSDADWARWEYELCRASAEGRIRGGLNNDGIPVSR